MLFETDILKNFLNWISFIQPFEFGISHMSAVKHICRLNNNKYLKYEKTEQNHHVLNSTLKEAVILFPVLFRHTRNSTILAQ